MTTTVAFNEKIVSLREELNETAEKFLIENFKELFSAHKTLSEITWEHITTFPNKIGNQYQINANIKGVDSRSFEYSLVKSELELFMSNFDDNLMYNLFGEHVKVIVTKDGISIEDC